jgi:hypothetical protein
MKTDIGKEAYDYEQYTGLHYEDSEQERIREEYEAQKEDAYYEYLRERKEHHG